MEFLISFVITLVVVTVVLLVSMTIVGRFMSIDFGDLNTVLAKSAGLIIAVSLCHQVSPLLALGVWLVGLMVLFKLGVVEAVVLTIVNEFLTFLLIAVLAAIILALTGGPRG